MNSSVILSSAWELVKLRDLCASKESCDPSSKPDECFEYVDISSVCNERFEIVSPKRIEGRDAPSRARKRIRTGDVLVATTRPYLRSIARVSEDLDGQVCSTGFCVLRPGKKIISDWIFYICLSGHFIRQLSEKMRGANYPAVTDRDVLEVCIPVPDVAEQRRIVARIKACMERVEEVGKLTFGARQESNSLSQAFRFDLWKECLDRYPLVELGSLIASAKNGLYKPRQHHGSGTLLLRMFNINGANFDTSRVERVNITPKEADDYLIENSDIIVSRVNSRELVGKSAVVAGLSEPAVFEAMLIRLRIDGRKARQDVLAWLINAPQFLHDLRMRAKHAIGQSSINQQDLLGSRLPLPPLVEQENIAEKYRDLESLAANLRGECGTRWQATEGLREAILRKAFAGEL